MWFNKSLWLCSPWYVTIQIKYLLKTGKANEWIKSYFRDRYQSVEVNIEMSITMHIYTGEAQNTVFHKDQYKIPYIFFIYISDCSKTIHGKYK